MHQSENNGVKGNSMAISKDTAETIIHGRLGVRDGGLLLRTLDRQGYTVVGKSELQYLRRAAARLEKLERQNGQGTKTGRMSVAKANLAQLPTEKTSPVKAAEKIRRANPARAERLRAETTNKRAVARRRV